MKKKFFGGKKNQYLSLKAGQRYVSFFICPNLLERFWCILFLLLNIVGIWLNRSSGQATLALRTYVNKTINGGFIDAR